MKDLHIIVCLKSVVLEAPRGRIVRTAENSVMNPFDRPAVEIALALRNEVGGTVTAVSMGPPVAGNALLEATAMGADRAVLLTDAAMAGADTLATAAVLNAAISQLPPFDLLVFGTRTADSDTGQVGPQTAVSLGVPMITQVSHMEPAGTGCRLERQCDGFTETYECAFPAAVSVNPDAVVPREIGLGDLETAFGDKAYDVWGLEQIGLSPEATGESGSPTRVLTISPVKTRKACEFIEGDDAQKRDELINHLSNAGLIG
ncbi:MAG: electron transfer flavoprotein subunit beta/FixA family protein [Desulfobacteraceae bacterium]|nr:electron transfer flavoprotein subunit beta/FixA family protein [Desulfobacteraceae bacterium]